MNKGVIILLVVLLIFGGVLTYIGLTSEKEPENSEVSLFVKTLEKDSEIETKICIDSICKETTKGYNLFKVNNNSLATLRNENLEGQFYYSYNKEINVNEDKRLDIVLDKPENLSYEVNDSGILLSSENYKGLIFCIKYQSYIFVESTYEKITKPNEYKIYDKCYDTNLDLNSSLFIPIDYTLYNPDDEGRFIDINFMTREFLGDFDVKVKFK